MHVDVGDVDDDDDVDGMKWKSDYTIASVVLSERLGRLAAELAGWKGTRVGQDDIWWKPPGTKAISFHQDAPYFDFINPVSRYA